jgi:hypothetical protein
VCILTNNGYVLIKIQLHITGPVGNVCHKAANISGNDGEQKSGTLDSE